MNAFRDFPHGSIAYHYSPGLPLMCSPSRFSRSSAGYSTAPLKVPRGCLEPLMEEPELYPTWMDSRQSESTIRTLPLSPISMHSDDSQKLSEPISERILPLEDSCGPSQLQLLDDLSPDLKQSNENVHSMHDKESDSSQALKETSNGQKKCTVENCTPSFGRTVELERHLNELHAPKLYYPVISCELHTVDLGFGQKEELTQHLEREHSEDAVAASSHPPMPTKRELNPPKSNTSMFKKLVSTGANPTTQLLYAILSQMSLKDIDWNKVARHPILSERIANGHAARMRYCRFKRQMDAALSYSPIPTKKPNPPESNTYIFQELVSTKADPTTQLLYAILSQMSLKDIDWNKVARHPILLEKIAHGHAARMRYCRFKRQMDAALSYSPIPTKKKQNPPESNAYMFQKLVSTRTDPTTQLLYAILSQKCLKDIDWNKVARHPILLEKIANGHAARMRYCRFKRQIDAKVPKPQNTNSTTPQTQFIASTEDTHITALSGSNESMKLESSCSEHDTNWDEESGSENQVHQYSISRGDLSGDYTNNLVIPPAEVKVADAPMEEVLFKQDWVSTLRKCTPGSTLPTANTADPASQQASSSHGAKRRRESDVQGNPEEGDEGDESDSSHKLKRARTSKESMNIIKFACPYRKHDPRRYSVLKWAPCALTPHKTVARVKGHLYRYHMIYQCPRCKTLFESQQALDIHIVKPKGCPVNISGRAEGITSQTRQQLQCRKKAYCGQSDPELWQNIYRILFPTEEPPSPWFEPIQEDTADGPDSREIGRIEDYLRLQVPQYVRSALESAVDSEMQPIDERLRAQLMDMVEEAQNRAFSDYHAVLNSRERISSMSGSRHSSAPGLATMNQSSNILDDFYVPPQPRSHLDPGVDCPFGTVAGSSTLNEWSDTGYSSSLPEQPTEQPVATRGGDCLLPTRATQILNDPIHEYIGHTSETQFNHPPSATSQEAVGRVAIGTLSLHNDNSKLGAHDLFAFDFDKYESLYDLSSHAQ